MGMSLPGLGLALEGPFPSSFRRASIFSADFARDLLGNGRSFGLRSITPDSVCFRGCCFANHHSSTRTLDDHHHHRDRRAATLPALDVRGAATVETDSHKDGPSAAALTGSAFDYGLLCTVMA